MGSTTSCEDKNCGEGLQRFHHSQVRGPAGCATRAGYCKKERTPLFAGYGPINNHASDIDH